MLSNFWLLIYEILLLQFRDELIFNSTLSTKLVRWNESGECCLWHGVECDASGYVVSLQLDDEAISGGIGDSSSLFRFKYLQKLNLAYNFFYHTDVYTGLAIPKGIGNLIYLTHLNLSYAGFDGQVPSEISTLTRLASLDISGYGYIIPEKPNLEMLVKNLTELRELYLDDVRITSLHERKNWGHIISSHLPNLTSLSLSYCNLFGPLPKSFWQLHSLSILRLDGNDLSAVALDDLFTNFPSLTTLTLSDCKLNGSIPSTFGNLTKLIHVDLSSNHFTGSLPSTLFANLTKLIHVDLAMNSLTGSLSSTFFEGLSNLLHLYLLGNSFSGNIPRSLFALPSLLELVLSNNQFNGTFQLNHLQSLPNLTVLGLSGNSLSVDVGNFNSSSSGGFQLKVLDLASCNLSKFPDFIKYLDLERLDLSNNHIGGEIPSWVWGAQLEHLDLSFNLFTHMQKPYLIPASLRFLSLDSNQLKGKLQLPIPLESQLQYIDIANNSLSGELQLPIPFMSNVEDLFLADNNLSGSIPTSLCNATHLRVLDLSGNILSGSIPPCLLGNFFALDLSRNNISGDIPDDFSMGCTLQYINLNNNSLEGKIPRSLSSCLLMYMNVGNNMLNDTFPCMLAPSLLALVLHSNRFHGYLRCHINWPNLQILDVSSNNFSGSLESINFSSWTAMMLPSDGKLRGGTYGSMYSSIVTLTMKGQVVELPYIRLDFCTIDLSSNNFYGKIPNAIGDLTSLHQLNFSHNSLNGIIPKSFGQLKNLESLDLSVNQLAGPIPEELGGLTFLSKLNLSYNKFVGAIPKGRQIQTFSADSFQGNPGLCGFPLDINCINTNVPPPGFDENGEEKREIEWEYVCAAVGYVVGVGSIVWLLLFCRSFREKYFGKIEEVVEDMFIARDMRRRRARRAAAAMNRVRRQ
ncbi:receptor-like protein 7 isoform X2 [Salvia splendens]|uniref:receptor-like protein 7 isoform X2 n=1 Tax=Salvia splendens TaxID=180675 RepID=UPI001C27C648|nr:receptor-like protein 7 isoform X2 [Salvia splendens]